MAKKSKQYSFHLNLNNSDHLRVYRTLEDLNTDIHKSVSNFVIKAILQYINEASRSNLTRSGKSDKDNLDAYVTRQELAEERLLMKADIMKEVAQLFSNAAINSKPVMPQEFLEKLMEMMPEHAEKKKEVVDEQTEEPTDLALEEMSVLFAQGNFGEE